MTCKRGEVLHVRFLISTAVLDISHVVASVFLSKKDIELRYVTRMWNIFSPLLGACESRNAIQIAALFTGGAVICWRDGGRLWCMAVWFSV
jgi:hypothetical protein